jgi:hypothetical protein
MKEKIGKLFSFKIFFFQYIQFLNRTFQHARDEAITERDRHIQLERDLQRKYDELLNE